MKAGEAKERLDTAVTGTMAAQKIEAGGDAGEKATPTTVDMSAVQTLIGNWPPMSRKRRSKHSTSTARLTKRWRAG